MIVGCVRISKYSDLGLLVEVGLVNGATDCQALDSLVI